MDLTVSYLCPLISLYETVFFSVSMVFYSTLLRSLAYVEKFYFLPPASVHATTHTFVLSHFCKGG